MTDSKKSTEKWCPELWEDIEFEIDTKKVYYGPSEEHQFIEPKTPKRAIS